jgi:hypothetical protein
MTQKKTALLAALTIVVLFGGCGDNTGGPVGSVGIPKDLKAISLDQSTIQLQWSPPEGIVDSVFEGYRIQYLDRDETIPKTSLSYVAASLPPGDVVFTLFARGSRARLSDGVSIRWAPAARFDSMLVLTEYSSADLSLDCCLDMGSALRDPSVTSFSAPGARQFVHLYLWGESTVAGQPASPLELRSPNLYSVSFNASLFSPVTHSASTLDYPLAEFPQEFSQQTMAVKDNTIYYVRILGENATVFYARLHVKVLGGAAPDRTIGVTISLQRVAALPLASRRGGARQSLALAVPVIGCR